MSEELFSKENVSQIIVPDIVKDDLLSIIEEKLTKAGFYYRIAYRVKSADSITDKLAVKQYRIPGSANENKKMQDLIGIRIIMYYVDDVAICRNLLDSIFAQPGVWDTTEATEYEFKAMKINGIFKLPAYLSKTIVNPLLSEYIDDTFEVQIRTNSFEGWHEIEHDLRYKGTAFGVGNEALARKMNSILATFELCDDSIMTLVEDLGHQHYKDKKWGNMIRCHYRLRLDSELLNPRIVDFLDNDTDFAKKLFKFKRAEVIKYLWNSTGKRKHRLQVNDIVEIVNELGPNNEELKARFAQIHKEDSDKENESRRRKFEPFKKLESFKVFQAKTHLEIANLGKADAFRKASSYIYSWIRSRFKEVFESMSEEVTSMDRSCPGYTVYVEYDPDNMIFRQRSSHPDTKIATRVWISTAEIRPDGDGLIFSVINQYAEPGDRYRDTENILFSRPNFFGEIADNIGIYDVVRLKEQVKQIDSEERYDEMISLINSGNRRFPVIVFIAEENDWIEKFDVNYFAYLIGYYAHIKYITDPELAVRFCDKYGLDKEQYRDSITVFYKGQEPMTSYRQDIMNTTFEVIKLEKKKYWNENGCRAYRRQLISQIRENNVVAYR